MTADAVGEGTGRLADALVAAVPIWHHDLELPATLDEHMKTVGEIADLLATKGDILLYGGGKKGEVAEAFNALAKGIAVLSCVPNGIEAFGYRWIGGQPEPLKNKENS